jgi:hypothetical protein
VAQVGASRRPPASDCIRATAKRRPQIARPTHVSTRRAILRLRPITIGYHRTSSASNQLSHGQRHLHRPPSAARDGRPYDPHVIGLNALEMQHTMVPITRAPRPIGTWLETPDLPSRQLHDVSATLSEPFAEPQLDRASAELRSRQYPVPMGRPSIMPGVRLPMLPLGRPSGLRSQHVLASARADRLPAATFPGLQTARQASKPSSPRRIPRCLPVRVHLPASTRQGATICAGGRLPTRNAFGARDDVRSHRATPSRACHGAPR